jgi:hypothetical protein
MLTVCSSLGKAMDTLSKMANGQATKIIFPFEISKVIEQSAKYLGASEENVPEVGASTDIERIVGKPEDVLGKIPNPDELRAQVEDIESQLKRDLEDTAKTAKDIKKMGAEKSSDLLEHNKK